MESFEGWQKEAGKREWKLRMKNMIPVNLHKEEALKNLYCYDRSLGHYWALQRELSNKEWLSLGQLGEDGERLADILEELKVLK